MPKADEEHEPSAAFFVNAWAAGDVSRAMTLNDARGGLRQLAKSPGFTAVAVLSLALGIGANTAVFSLINGVLLRSLPVEDPDRLVLFRTVDGRDGRMSRAGENNGSIDPATGRASSTSFSLLTFERFRQSRSAAADVFAFAPFNNINVLVDGSPETNVLGQLVSGNYHSGLGVRAIVGRTLTAADDRPGAEPVAVISHRYFEDRFAGEPSVVGKTVLVNRVAVTVVGVTPPGFAGAMQVGESADISLPLAHHGLFQPDRATSRAQPWYWWIRMMARLAPGSTATDARASLEPILQQSAREGWLAGRSLPGSSSEDAMPEAPTLAADPGGQGENDARRQYARSLRVLMGIVGLLLLAACANVANLLLARSAARRREIALRLALGASRSRVVRQLLTESLFLALLGTALGVVFAYWGRDLLVAMRQFSGAQVVLDLPLDGRVLGFTMAAAVATALLFGLAPALRATRIDLAAEFQGGARQLGAGARSRLSQGLMVVQIAISLVLLVGTALFARTLRNLQAVDPGFDSSRLALFRIDARSAGYSPDQFAPLHERIRERLASIPGVGAATFSSVPLLSGTRSNRRISIPGEKPQSEAALVPNTNGLAPNFFEAMRIPVLRGRPFRDGDSSGAPSVAVVNQVLAHGLFGASDPIGRRIVMGATPGSAARELEIVGMARDIKYATLRDSVPPTLYLPAAQQRDGNANYSVRSAGDPARVFAAIRAAVREVDPTLPLLNLRTQDEQIARSSAQERLFARLSGFFGGLALALASAGLYGLMSYRVVRRTGEIGLRMALGALPGQVLRLILSESAGLVALGAGLGIAAAIGSARFLESMLFGLSPLDVPTYASVTVVLVAVAFLAALLPARRATKLNPVAALRADQ